MMGLFAAVHESGIGRYCCKSPKLPGANFLAVKKSDLRPPIDVAPITLPRSPASLSSSNEVPHIFTRKSRVQPKEILITSAKRLPVRFVRCKANWGPATVLTSSPDYAGPSTGTFQISRAYSLMARSEENQPMLATLRRLMRAQTDADCHSRSIRRCVA
jgi:hypothetical protein